MARHYVCDSLLKLPPDDRLRPCRYVLEIREDELGSVKRALWIEKEIKEADSRLLEVLETLFRNTSISYSEIFEITEGGKAKPDQDLANVAQGKMSDLKKLLNDQRQRKSSIWKNAAGERDNLDAGAYQLRPDCKVEAFPGLKKHHGITRTRIFASATSHLALPLQVIVHTVAMAQNKHTHVFREIARKDDIRPDERPFDDLTGLGEANALSLIDRYGRNNDVTLQQPPLPAGEYADRVFWKASILWLGSAFNRNHKLVKDLEDTDLWSEETRCRFEHLDHGIKVSWPQGSDIVNTDTAPDVRYMLLRHAKFTKCNTNPSLLIAAGTDTKSTLFGAKVLMGYGEDGIAKPALDELLDSAAGQSPSKFEALFKLCPDEKKVECVWSSALSA